MVKMILSALLLLVTIHANNLQQRCLSCHAREQIPNIVTYNRYLMKYSSKERIARAMYVYMKNPKNSSSVMPSQFFLKFPLMPKLELEDDILQQEIKEYINIFDIQKRLKLKKNINPKRSSGIPVK